MGVAKETEKPRGGSKEETQRVTAAPQEQVMYEGVPLSELPRDRLYAHLGQLIEEIEYRKTALGQEDEDTKKELQTIATILSKHIIRYKLSADENAALAASVRKIRDTLQVAPAAPEPRAVAAQAPAQKAEAQPVSAGWESLAADYGDGMQNGVEVLTNLNAQLKVISTLLANPDFDPATHKLQVSLDGVVREMPVLHYLSEQKEVLLSFSRAAVFASDRTQHNIANAIYIETTKSLALCEERKRQKALQLSEAAEKAVSGDAVYIRAKKLLNSAKDFSKKPAAESRTFLTETESVCSEIDDKLTELYELEKVDLLDQAGVSLRDVLGNIQGELEIKYRIAHFYAEYAVFSPQWDLLLNSVPTSREKMLSQKMDLSVISALKNQILELYGQMAQAGLTQTDAVTDAEVLKLVQRLDTKRRDIIQFIDEQLLTLPNPQTMSLDEVVAEVLTSTGIYSSDIRYPQLKNRYEKLIPEVTDPYKRAIIINAVSTLSAAVLATSQARDFAANLNKVMDPFAGDGGALNTLATMLMDGHGHDGPITEKEINEGRLQVDMRAVKMWDFIVDRIKHHEKWGGKDWTVKQLLPLKDGETDAAYVLRVRLIQARRNNRTALQQLIPKLNGEDTQLYTERIAAILRDPTTVQPFEYDEEYVVKMEGESENAFISRLNAMAKLDQSFSYDSIAEDVVGQFEKMIDLVFADIDPQKRVLLRNFYKTFGARSAAYVSSYLGAGRTRGHGFKSTETDKKDEAAYCHPWKIRLYRGGRYERLNRGRSLSWMTFISKEQFVGMLAQNFDTHYPAKAESALELYELYELFCKAKWGRHLPLWITETRKLFESPELSDISIDKHVDHETIEDLRDRRLFEGAQIDLDERMFPLLPDLVTNVMKVEQQKRDLMEELTNLERQRRAMSTTQYNRRKQTLDAKVATFVDTYKFQGYFNYGKLKTAQAANNSLGMLRACYGQKALLGGQDSPNTNLVQYGLGMQAVEKMFDTFDTPLKKSMDLSESKHAFNKWTDGIIGKAKLIPGSHHLLFAPLTCSLLTNILNNYKEGHNRQKVNELYRMLIKEFVLVDALPTYFQEEVVRLMGGNINNAPEYCVYGPRDIYTELYMRKLYLIESEERTDLATKLKRMVPLASEGDFRIPYDEEGIVEKVTTSDANNEKH